MIFQTYAIIRAIISIRPVCLTNLSIYLHVCFCTSRDYCLSDQTAFYLCACLFDLSLQSVSLYMPVWPTCPSFCTCPPRFSDCLHTYMSDTLNISLCTSLPVLGPVFVNYFSASLSPFLHNALLPLNDLDISQRQVFE